METTKKTDAETFDERCPMYQLFDLLGKKWIFFILVLIKQDCNTFNVILKKIPKLNPKILSERLDLLVEKGWIERHVTSEKPLKITYIPTKVGIELSQKLEDLGAWIKKISK